MGEEIFGEAEYFTEGLQLEVLPKILVRESLLKTIDQLSRESPKH